LGQGEDNLHALYARADDISMRIGKVCKRQPHDDVKTIKELRKERSLIWGEIVIVEEMLGFGEREVVDDDEDEEDPMMGELTKRREEGMFDLMEEEYAAGAKGTVDVDVEQDLFDGESPELSESDSEEETAAAATAPGIYQAPRGEIAGANEWFLPSGEKNSLITATSIRLLDGVLVHQISILFI
jgi:hypothetical protein